MVDTVTAHYGWTMPGDHVNTNTWGAEWNSNLAGIDSTVWTINVQVQPNAIYPSASTMDWYLTQGDGYRMNNWAANWADRWNDLNGTRDWTGPSGDLMVLDGSGNLNVTGFLGATGLYPSIAAANDWYLTISGGSRIHNWAAQWADEWRVSDGMRTWTYTSGTPMTLDGTGNLTVTGGITSPGDGSFNRVYIAEATDFNLSGNSSERFLGFSTNWYLGWNTSSGVLRWVSNDISPAQVLEVDGTGTLTIAGQAWKPGGGVWQAPSDARIKNVLGEYEAGLDEVLRLRPVVYTYKGNDTPTADFDLLVPSGDRKEMVKATAHSGSAPYPASPHVGVATSQKQFVGFVAQELETVLPGMVSKNTGFIDGQAVSDLRGVDTSELIFALVNSVKELKAEIEALKAAR